MVQQITAFTEESLAAFEKRQQSMAHTATSPPRWILPSAECPKLNVDASWFKDFCGVGSILRNHQGAILFASCKQLFHVTSPLQAEALAALEGIYLALSCGFVSIELESDSSLVVNKLKQMDDDSSEISSFIMTIKSLYSHFQFVSFSHVLRASNIPAHLLAQKARFSAFSLWFNNFPSDVSLASDSDFSL